MVLSICHGQVGNGEDEEETNVAMPLDAREDEAADALDVGTGPGVPSIVFVFVCENDRLVEECRLVESESEEGKGRVQAVARHIAVHETADVAAGAGPAERKTVCPPAGTAAAVLAVHCRRSG